MNITSFVLEFDVSTETFNVVKNQSIDFYNNFNKSSSALGMASYYQDLLTLSESVPVEYCMKELESKQPTFSDEK